MKTNPESRRCDWSDLECVAIMKRVEDRVEYTAFQVMGREKDESPLFLQPCSGPGKMESADKESEAEVWCRGTVDGDGVIEYRFVTEDACALMGRPDAMKLGEVFMRIFDVACELMPEYAADMREMGKPISSRSRRGLGWRHE